MPLRSGKALGGNVPPPRRRRAAPPPADDDDSSFHSDDSYSDFFEGGKTYPPLSPDLVERNPMMNPVILKNLFAVCDLRDLRRFRLVSKLWRDICNPPWRNEMIVPIMSPRTKHYTSATGGLGRYVSEYTGRLVTLTKVVLIFEHEEFANNPFRTFKLQNWDWKVIEGAEELKSNCARFWELCGPWMHSLHLHRFDFRVDAHLVKIIAQDTPNLRKLKLTELPRRFTVSSVEGAEEVRPQVNLKSLEISLDVDNWSLASYRAIKFPIPWRYLFRLFPNLEELECGKLDEKDLDHTNFVSALGQLNLSRVKGKGRKLGMKINGVDENTNPQRTTGVLLRLIEVPELNIRKLEINLLDQAILPNFFSKAFELHGSTLKDLDVYGEYPCTMPSPEDYLTNLTNLKCTSDTFHNFNFLEYLPKLKTMEMCGVPMDKMMARTDLSRLESIRLENLTELRVSVRVTSRMHCTHIEEPSESEMRLLVKWMPNVTKFVGKLSNKRFRILCENWRELKELDLLDSDKIDDFGITGFEGKVGAPRLPNVTDLKMLRKFKGPRVHLTENSIADGFLHLPHLYFLEVELSRRTSNEAYMEIFIKCPTLRLRRRRWKLNQKVDNKFRARANKLLLEYGIGKDVGSDYEKSGDWKSYVEGAQQLDFSGEEESGDEEESEDVAGNDE